MMYAVRLTLTGRFMVAVIALVVFILGAAVYFLMGGW